VLVAYFLGHPVCCVIKVLHGKYFLQLTSNWTFIFTFVYCHLYWLFILQWFFILR